MAATFEMSVVHTAIALQEQSGTYGSAKRRVLLLTCDGRKQHNWKRLWSKPSFVGLNIQRFGPTNEQLVVGWYQPTNI